MICCWVREGQTLSEDPEPLSSIFEEKRRGGREGDEEEGLRDLRVGFGSRDRGSASPIFKQGTCTMPHGVVRLPTKAIGNQSVSQLSSFMTPTFPKYICDPEA